MKALENRQDVIDVIQHHAHCLTTIKRALTAREAAATTCTASMVHEITVVLDHAAMSTTHLGYCLRDTAGLIETAVHLTSVAAFSIKANKATVSEYHALTHFEGLLDSLQPEIVALAEKTGNAESASKDGAA